MNACFNGRNGAAHQPIHQHNFDDLVGHRVVANDWLDVSVVG
jgi:hypothetical protein